MDCFVLCEINILLLTGLVCSTKGRACRRRGGMAVAPSIHERTRKKKRSQIGMFCRVFYYLFQIEPEEGESPRVLKDGVVGLRVAHLG